MKINCKNCNGLIGKGGNIYCSNVCQRHYEWKIRKIAYEINNAIPPSPKVARRYLIDKFGYICTVCELSNWRNKLIPLVCDHIDGNADNWSIDNLRMICCNCDAQTDTYKNKNAGKGRHSRRIRYAEGKSY